MEIEHFTIEQMDEYELKEIQERIEKRLFIIKRDQEISNLEWRLRTLKDSKFEDSKIQETQEEFDYTHR
jgi:argonaute-like protein implicated in RNA metabolism and viral defense